MNLGMPRERAPERGRHEPQDFGAAQFFGPDDVEEPVVEPRLGCEPEPRAVGGPEGRRDQYGSGLDEFLSVEPERGLVASETPEQPSYGPQVPPRPSQTHGRICYTGRDLRVEAYAEPVVESDPVDLPGVYGPDAALDEYIECPPEVGTYPKRFNVVVAAADRQHSHNQISPDTARRHLVYRPVPTHRDHQSPVWKSLDDAPRVPWSARHVPDHRDPVLLHKARNDPVP